MTLRAVAPAGPDTPDTDTPDMPDMNHALVRARAGDQSAFAELVRRHQAMVFGLALHVLHHHAEAEDVAQDVFVALHQNLSRIESAAHVKHWLCTVTSRRCIDRVRRVSWRLERLIGRVPDRPAPARGDDLLMAAMLRDLVAELKPAARLVVTLRFQEDLQLLEIAEILDMPINTVKSHLHRALETLRSRLADRGTFNDA